jgi:hypothetical protein
MLLSARWSAQSARAAVSSRTLPKYPISDPEAFAESMGQKCREQGSSGEGPLGLLAPASSIEGKALIVSIWCRRNPARGIDERHDLLQSLHLLYPA